ncbi:hypothetical protein ABFS82_14G054500 [Erythranthe guttata]|uniref:Endoplasmic reticulum transmembrane protein n=1 Tax=Erythranthe guttata TaxID=4155 RepID=A0A022RKT8_ERYGU|nr:PREDICTED: B-cell receptor-associated protein 29-like [Erythranthe guttata]EYU40619.1 hypothetical protein MIMGU_mgv1a013665mg [Erythranthe guttata]|eukprot:XP_012833541.1 PREDICTED: B-cell receptor-associated protein 29-like [Erythranthe guttata]
MIVLFFYVVLGEGLVALLLMFEIGPLRELGMKGLDQVKMRRATVLTIAATVFVILLSDLFSIFKIQNKGAKHGAMTPMDQVLWRTNVLEATLMGFFLFLGLLIDRMHHHMRKLDELKSSNGVSKEEFDRVEREKLQLKENQEKTGLEVERLRKEISGLTENVKKLKLESTEKDKSVKSAEARVASLQKQTAELLLEYDRLLEDNQNLQNQVER